MIVTEAELRLLLGLADEITDEEHAVLQTMHGEAESLVMQFLGYDPEQKSHTEYYPRHTIAGGVGVGGREWDINAAGTHAVSVNTYSGYASYNSIGESLQLQHIPVRQVTSVHVDYDAKHGSGSSFGADTEWTVDDDCWMERDEDDVAMSGMLMTRRGWPLEHGTVKVVYVAGYTPAEFAGRADADAQAADALNGLITTPGLSAAGIKRAVTATVTKMMHQWNLLKKGATGFSGGNVFQSEKFQDYSYTRPAGSDGGGLISQILSIGLPPEAEEALEGFRHYGLMRL